MIKAEDQTPDPDGFTEFLITKVREKLSAEKEKDMAEFEESVMKGDKKPLNENPKPIKQ